VQFWIVVVGAGLLWLVFGDTGRSQKRTEPQASYAPPNYTPQYTSPIYSTPSAGWRASTASMEEKDDGEYECTATNLSTGNGPYSLTCEKDGDEVIIRFPNGGYITVDEDGYHARRGEQWEIELEE